MAINKTISSKLDDSITLSFHKVLHLEINALGKFIVATYGSYFDKSAYQADKEAGKTHRIRVEFSEMTAQQKQKLADFEDVVDDITLTALKNDSGKDNELESGTKDT